MTNEDSSITAVQAWQRYRYRAAYRQLYATVTHVIALSLSLSLSLSLCVCVGGVSPVLLGVGDYYVQSRNKV